MPEKETCLVVGSNAFSGASFIASLLDEGYSVIGCSRSPELHPAFLPYKWSSQESKFNYFQCDLNSDLDLLMSVVQRERPSYVVNFAAQSMVAESWEHPEHWFMTNVVSTVRLHDQLRKCDFLQRYVHITTPEVYGSTRGKIDESAVFNPSTPYAVSRAAADMSLKTFCTAYGFPVVFTRAANVFGPGQQLYRIIPRMILAIRLGKKLQLHGGGCSERSFIHIRDVSDAVVRIMREGALGESYHISTDRIVSVRDVVEIICARMGVRFEDNVDVVGERLGKDSEYILSSEKLRNKLGWHDRISLEEGVDETITWVNTWLEDLKQQPLSYVHRT